MIAVMSRAGKVGGHASALPKRAHTSVATTWPTGGSQWIRRKLASVSSACAGVAPPPALEAQSCGVRSGHHGLHVRGQIDVVADVGIGPGGQEPVDGVEVPCSGGVMQGGGSAVVRGPHVGTAVEEVVEQVVLPVRGGHHQGVAT